MKHKHDGKCPIPEEEIFQRGLENDKFAKFDDQDKFENSKENAR